MSLSDQIQALIDQVKTQKNNLQRNKIISHLEDALAHAKVQQSWVPPSLAMTAPSVVPNDTRQVLDSSGKVLATCICPDGATDSTCPIHGNPF